MSAKLNRLGRIFAQLSRQVDAEMLNNPLELETQLNFLDEQICYYNFKL